MTFEAQVMPLVRGLRGRRSLLYNPMNPSVNRVYLELQIGGGPMVLALIHLLR